MYKMARKPVPQYVGGSSSTNNMFDDLHIPSVMKSNYHIISTPTESFHNPSTQSTDELPISHTTMAIKRPRANTGTRDLAEFLKSSRPEDYGRAATSSSLDDLSVSNPTPRKGLRFLRSSLSKEHNNQNTITRVISPGPVHVPHVVPKTTSKGKAYMQIQVDYGQAESIETGNEGSIAMHSEASNSNYRNSLPNLVSENRHLNEESPNANSQWNAAPENNAFVVEPMDSYQQFYQLQSVEKQATPTRNRLQAGPTLSLKTAPQDIAGQPRRRQGATLQTPTSTFRPLHSPVDGAPKTPDRSSVVSIDLSTYYTTPVNTQAPPLNAYYHVRSKSQDNSIRSDNTPDDTSIDGLSDAPVKHSVHIQGPQSGVYYHQTRKLPKPGPPPNRGLPSLPESYDERMGLARIAIPQQPAVRRSESPVSVSPTEENVTRKTRQERVRARKARDMGQMQKTRATNDVKLQEAIRGLDDDVEKRERQSQASSSYTTSTTTSSSSSGRRPSTTKHARRDSVDKVKKGNSSPTKVIMEAPTFTLHSEAETQTPPRSPSPRANMIIAGESRRASQSNPIAPPPLPSSRKNSYAAATTRETELETRLTNVERRNWVLEHALIAILQRVAGREGPAQQGRDTLESLLAELDCEIPIPP